MRRRNGGEVFVGRRQRDPVITPYALAAHVAPEPGIIQEERWCVAQGDVIVFRDGQYLGYAQRSGDRADGYGTRLQHSEAD